MNEDCEVDSGLKADEGCSKACCVIDVLRSKSVGSIDGRCFGDMSVFLRLRKPALLLIKLKLNITEKSVPIFVSLYLKVSAKYVFPPFLHPDVCLQVAAHLVII